jgi:hypothetical protein
MPNDENAVAVRSTDNLQRIADWVSKDTDLTDEVEGVMYEITRDHKRDMNAYMMALTRRKVQQLTKILSILDNIEDQMRDPVRFASTKDLVAIYRALSQEAAKTTELLLASQNAAPKFTFNDRRTISFEFSDLNERKSRDRVREVFGALLKRAQDLTINDDDIIEVANK